MSVLGRGYSTSNNFSKNSRIFGADSAARTPCPDLLAWCQILKSKENKGSIRTAI
jgi:hypothetical protein